MGWLSTAVSVAGLFMQAKGASDSAEAARAGAARRQVAANFEADQLLVNAGQSVAAAQRSAMDQRRAARLVQSRALAVAAAGGGGVSDPTIVNLLGKVAGEGAYRANVALYEGEERARAMRMSAAARRYEGEIGIEAGEASARAYESAGTGAILKGAGSLYSKYAGNGPSGDAALVAPGWGGTAADPWYG